MNGESVVEVELDVFSGRPNPRWRLSTEQIDRVRGQLRELAPISGLVPADLQGPPGLGYRGFMIANLGQDREIPRQFRVYGSVATVLEPDKETYYRGAEGIEETLLEHARRLGYGELIDQLRTASTSSEQENT
jgi:hypothetical protein